jgi:hypothetical protein
MAMLSAEELDGIIHMLKVSRATSDEGAAHMLAHLIDCALAEALTLQAQLASDWDPGEHGAGGAAML